jgi:hypothetical protein
MFQASRVAAIISILLLFLALSRRWPFGFYTLLRLTVCASAVYIAFQAHRFNRAVWTWVLGGVAVLFNPIVPIYMRRTQWRWFDLLALLAFMISLGVVRHKTGTMIPNLCTESALSEAAC